MENPIRGHRGDQGQWDFWRHLADLRRCLLWSVLGWVAAGAVCWNWWPLLWEILVFPVKAMPNPPKIIVTSPTAAVTMSFQLALVAGSLLAAPWVLWQFWRFISPALFARERNIAGWAMLWTTTLFVLGATVGYFTIVPMTVKWLAEYSGTLFEQLWTVDEYTTMVVKLLLGFALMFEWPLLTYVLGSFGMVTPRRLLSWSRGAIVLIFILAAILTPPDPVSQCIMAAPMLLLYFFGIATAAFALRKKGT